MKHLAAQKKSVEHKTKMEKCNRSTDSDGLNLLRIFPEEVWELVLNKLVDPDDLINCCNTSTYFKELLESRKNSYLFSKVLTILDTEKYFDWTDSSEILQCRLVCHTWNAAINRHLQIRPYHLKLPEYLTAYCYRTTESERDIASDSVFELYRYSYDKLETQMIPEFEKPFYKNHCPFPSRDVHINEQYIRENNAENERNINVYRDMAKTFLNLVGHHIWHVTIDIGYFGNLSLLEWYTLLKTYVELMPNLKSLHIEGPFNFRNQDDSEDIQRNLEPFPALKDLNLLSVERVLGAIVDKILAKNEPNILDASWRCNSNWFPFHRIKNTQQLAISFRSEEEFQQVPEDWRPTVLQLGLPVTNMAWSRVFERMEFYGETLLELKLAMTEAVTEEGRRDVWECSKRPLNLPNVRKLTIGTQNHCGWDFLLGLKKLESLCLKFILYSEESEREESEGKNLLINFHEVGAYRFMECNIWELIPTLKKVRLDLDYDGEKLVCIRGSSTWSRYA